jgi:hypothetical protein
MWFLQSALEEHQGNHAWIRDMVAIWTEIWESCGIIGILDQELPIAWFSSLHPN